MSRELEIIHRICDFNFSEDWDSKTKTQSKVFERAIYYKLSKEFTKISLAEIGRRINKDHATVLHGLKVFEKDIRESKRFSSYKKLYENLKQKCELRLLKKEFHGRLHLLRLGLTEQASGASNNDDEEEDEASVCADQRMNTRQGLHEVIDNAEEKGRNNRALQGP